MILAAGLGALIAYLYVRDLAAQVETRTFKATVWEMDPTHGVYVPVGTKEIQVTGLFSSAHRGAAVATMIPGIVVVAAIPAIGLVVNPTNNNPRLGLALRLTFIAGGLLLAFGGTTLAMASDHYQSGHLYPVPTKPRDYVSYWTINSSALPDVAWSAVGLGSGGLALTAGGYGLQHYGKRKDAHVSTSP
jgi:hypothetical protein